MWVGGWPRQSRVWHVREGVARMVRLAVSRCALCPATATAGSKQLARERTVRHRWACPAAAGWSAPRPGTRARLRPAGQQAEHRQPVSCIRFRTGWDGCTSMHPPDVFPLCQASPAAQHSRAQPTCDCCVKPPRPGGSARALVFMPPSWASRSRSRPRAALERMGGWAGGWTS